MGGGSWDKSYYTESAKSRKDTGIKDFEYSSRVHSGLESSIHELLNPKKIGQKGRESCDSDEHPESVAVAVIYDVTGSMLDVPEVMQGKLPKLMDTIVKKAKIEDAQILYGAIGDYYSDRYPFQVGQFESDNKSDEQLRNIILEGGGGGGNHESYELALYFAAHKTSIESFSKRGKKGYLFTIGDEKAYLSAEKDEIRDVFGDQIDSHIPLTQLVSDVNEKWNHFHLIPTNTLYRGNTETKEFWQKYLGEQVVIIDDENLICEVIAGLVYMMETTYNIDKIVDDMELSSKESESVKNALVPFADNALQISTANGNLPARSEKKGSFTRL